MDIKDIGWITGRKVRDWQEEKADRNLRKQRKPDLAPALKI